MLQTIRERLTGWVAVVILGLVALTLVLTFGAIDTGFTAAGTAATVNGKNTGIQTNLILAGISFENATLFSTKYIEAFSWAP